jgi:hypothetical protein
MHSAVAKREACKAMLSPLHLSLTLPVECSQQAIEQVGPSRSSSGCMERSASLYRAHFFGSGSCCIRAGIILTTLPSFLACLISLW